ncbi:hypothetical protein [Ravibacter arvi]|uniref:hypothetical protein n=1 Tax=Ravibacter arvi TaxID=2051041 RepID=UPI0031EF7531
MKTSRKIALISLLFFILFIVFAFVLPPYTLFPRMAAEEYGGVSKQKLIGRVFFLVAFTGMFILLPVSSALRKMKRRMKDRRV